MRRGNWGSEDRESGARVLSFLVRDGIGLVPIAMGLFGVSEVFLNIEELSRTEVFKKVFGSKMKSS